MASSSQARPVSMRPQPANPPMFYGSTHEYRSVVLMRGESGFDFCVKGGKEHKFPIVISRVFPGGVADRCGDVHVGDEVVEVNGVIVCEMTHDNVVDCIRKSGDRCELKLRSNTVVQKYFRDAAGTDIEATPPPVINLHQPNRRTEVARAIPEAIPEAEPIAGPSAPPGPAVGAGVGTVLAQQNASTSSPVVRFSATLATPAAAVAPGASTSAKGAPLVPVVTTGVGSSSSRPSQVETIVGALGPTRPPADDALGPMPTGWEMAIDPATNRRFFIDHKTCTTSWVDPRLRLVRSAELSDCEVHELPFGWEEARDATGFLYYIDHVNRRTTWHHPQEMREWQQRLDLRKFIAKTTETIHVKRACLASVPDQRGASRTDRLRALFDQRKEALSAWRAAGSDAAHRAVAVAQLNAVDTAITALLGGRDVKETAGDVQFELADLNDCLDGFSRVELSSPHFHEATLTEDWWSFQVVAKRQALVVLKAAVATHAEERRCRDALVGEIAALRRTLGVVPLRGGGDGSSTNLNVLSTERIVKGTATELGVETLLLNKEIADTRREFAVLLVLKEIFDLEVACRATAAESGVAPLQAPEWMQWDDWFYRYHDLVAHRSYARISAHVADETESFRNKIMKFAAIDGSELSDAWRR